ncbi:hypothetical protein [Azohydromonas aeria]|uniref:hypothetical protein n=1 Tax=Azohydromonas aeria TaxID=2590212 RepID=UPI0012FA8E51|nr:hypothetical protein [Azohydromonas aeria]
MPRRAMRPAQPLPAMPMRLPATHAGTNMAFPSFAGAEDMNKGTLFSTLMWTAGLLVSPLAHAQDSPRTPLPPDHPLLGTWRIDLPDLKCFEEYELRADGTKRSVSGEERNEFEFTVSPTPSDKGFYRWTEKVVKTNGQPDCSGNRGEVGQAVSGFIKLHPGQDKFLLCTGEDFKRCFAEFYRKR